MSVPFHKQLDPNKQAGQHVYGFDREPYLKHSNVAPDVTLSDYIARKTESLPVASVPPELDVRRIMLDVAPGEDGMGQEVFAKSVDQVVALLTDMGQRIEDLEAQHSAPRRITFDEWWKKYDGGPVYSNTGIAESAAEDIWNAALTKGKL